MATKKEEKGKGKEKCGKKGFICGYGFNSEFEISRLALYCMRIYLRENQSAGNMSYLQGSEGKI